MDKYSQEKDKAASKYKREVKGRLRMEKDLLRVEVELRRRERELALLRASVIDDRTRLTASGRRLILKRAGVDFDAGLMLKIYFGDQLDAGYAGLSSNIEDPLALFKWLVRGSDRDTVEVVRSDLDSDRIEMLDEGRHRGYVLAVIWWHSLGLMARLTASRVGRFLLAIVGLKWLVRLITGG